MKPEQKYNDLDIDNDSDNRQLPFGKGGGLTAGDASTSTTRDLRIASLFHHLWTDSAVPYKRRHLHNLYEPPPPPRYLSLSRGGGCRRQVNTRSTARCVFWTRTLHELGYVYSTQQMPYRAHTGKYFPIGTRVKNRNPKNSEKN